MSRLLIKNGEIINSTDRYHSDIYVENGVIVAIGKNMSKPSADTRPIDASGHYVFPGAVDAHIGEMPSDDFESGSAAGLAGGTTTIIDFVIPERNQSLIDGLKKWQARASKSVTDYAFHMAVSWFGENTAREMEYCVREMGITSFKTFTAYRGAIGVDENEMIRVMETARSLNALAIAHCENGEIITALTNKRSREGSALLELGATARAMMLARITGVPLYVVHVSSKETIQIITEARQRGQVVWGETCPQYLLPIDHQTGVQDALWSALRSGIVQTIATDHGQKAARIQDRLSLMYTYGVLAGKIDLNQFVNLNCTRPAKIFGMYPRKGTIMVGADADIVVWDPSKENTISAKSIFEGLKTKGAPTWVIANGKVQYDRGELKVQRGAGRYISRSSAHNHL
jgi:dihydropyrimidinase